MSGEMEWPEFGSNVVVKIDITSGVMSLISPSALVNTADFDFNSPNIRGAIFKNGVYAGAVSINSSTGALSMSGLAVNTGDAIRLDFQYLGRLSLPWNTRATIIRSEFLTVPAGNSVTIYDGSTNVQPVPSLDISFGWSSGRLKVGIKVVSADNATEDITVYTRLLGGSAMETSSAIDLANTSTAQTHTSSFDVDDLIAEVEFEMLLPSSSTTTKQQDRVRITWGHRADVPSYPGDPSGTKLVQQLKDSGKLKLAKV